MKISKKRIKNNLIFLTKREIASIIFNYLYDNVDNYEIEPDTKRGTHWMLKEDHNRELKVNGCYVEFKKVKKSKKLTGTDINYDEIDTLK